MKFLWVLDCLSAKIRTEKRLLWALKKNACVTHFYLGVLNNSYLLKIIIRKKGTT